MLRGIKVPDKTSSIRRKKVKLGGDVYEETEEDEVDEGGATKTKKSLRFLRKSDDALTLG